MLMLSVQAFSDFSVCFARVVTIGVNLRKYLCFYERFSICMRIETVLYQINLIRSFPIKSAVRGGPRDLALQIGLIGYNIVQTLVNYNTILKECNNE